MNRYHQMIHQNPNGVYTYVTILVSVALIYCTAVPAAGLKLPGDPDPPSVTLPPVISETIPANTSETTKTHAVIPIPIGSVPPVISETIPANTGETTKTHAVKPSIPTTPLRPPSGIFTATLNGSADAFKTALAQYMKIDGASVELLSPLPETNKVKFRFIDDGPGTPNPKDLEAKLQNMWAKDSEDVKKETGMSELQAPATKSTTEDSEGSIILPIVLAGICMLALVGAGVGAVMYKRHKDAAGFAVNTNRVDYLPVRNLADRPVVLMKDTADDVPKKDSYEDANGDVPEKDANDGIPMEDANDDVPMEDANDDVPMEDANYGDPMEDIDDGIPMEDIDDDDI